VSTPALQAQALTRRFGPVLAVDGVDLTVEQDHLVALVGPSGCGKTTTLRLLAGLDAGEGTIDIAGHRVMENARSLPPQQRPVGLVFQENVLFPHLSVLHNVAYGLDGPERLRTAAGLIDLLGLGELGRRMPHELSGGEQQRTALARTLATRPGLVLLDEPFAHLDASLREQVRDRMLDALGGTGTAGLLVTHDQAEALAVADRVVVMGAGRVHQEGTPQEVYHYPTNAFVASFVGRSTLLAGVRTGPREVLTELGPVHTNAPVPEERVQAVLRPESLEVCGPGQGVAATVVRSQFRGADHLARVRLPGGLELEVRRSAALLPGDSVELAVRGAVATVPHV
jgi:iron(III) transport system ATP-binding protein